MGISNKKILNLIGSLYEAARSQSADAWLDIYQQMTTLLSAGQGGLNIYLSDIKEFEMIASTIDPALVEQYNEYFQYVSPFRNLIVSMKNGDRFSRAQYCTDTDFLKTEIYRGFFKEQDVFNYEYQIFHKDQYGFAGISFSRPRGMKNFDDTEIDLIELITPHLQNAFQIYRKFAEVERDKLIISECLERVSQSVVVLDKFGKAVFLTDSAARILAEKDGLQINRDGTLSARSAHDSKRLRLLLRNVFEPALVEKIDYTKNVQISRSSGRRPFSVFVSPFYEKSVYGLRTETFALLFIKDPDEIVESIEPILSEVYNLTAAEAKLAVLLAQGRSISEVCEMLDIKPNTVRTHLKRIFSKTETTRQSELIKLILSGSVNLRKS